MTTLKYTADLRIDGQGKVSILKKGGEDIPTAPSGASRTPSYVLQNAFGFSKREGSDDIAEDAEIEESEITFTGRGNSPRDNSSR